MNNKTYNMSYNTFTLNPNNTGFYTSYLKLFYLTTLFDYIIYSIFYLSILFQEYYTITLYEQLIWIIKF